MHSAIYWIYWILIAHYFFLVFVLGSGSFSFIVIILKNTIFFLEIEKSIGLNVTILRKRNNFAA